MKITIEIDEKELMEHFIDAAIELDKDTVKRLIRGFINEVIYSLNPTTMRMIAEKFIDMENEINYRMEKRVRTHD